MKICLLTNCRPHEGGMTSHMNAFSSGLRKLGHQVKTVSFLGTTDLRQTKNNFVRKTDYFLTNGNFRTVLIYVLSEIWLFVVLFFSHLIHKYDFIYATDDSAANVACFFRKYFRLLVIHNVQSSLVKDLLNQKKIKPASFAYKFFSKQQKKAYQKVDLIIANSLYMKSEIQKFCVNHPPIEVSRNLIDEELFYSDENQKQEDRRFFGLENDKFIILCPARLVERKGVVYPLLALEQLIHQDRDYFLVYAGEGPERKVLSESIEQRLLGDFVKLLGQVAYKDLGKLYNAADVIVVPSVTRDGLCEPLGITALEGMASAKPVIASASGGLKETIKDSYNGILVPERDHQAIAQAVQWLKENPGRRKELIANGLLEIKNKYGKKEVAQIQMDFILKSVAQMKAEA